MSFFTPQTKVVDLGNGNSATVRKMTYGENIDALSKARDANGAIDGFLFTRNRMLTVLVSWTGDGFEGREINAQNVDALPTEIAGKINTAIAELNNEVTAEEGNASGAATN